MTKEEKIAYINAQSVAATAHIFGMSAENYSRVHNGLSIAYNDEAFFKVPECFGITHNQVMELFNTP